MRLAPIEKPPSLFMRLVYWLSRRQVGAVISPIQVIYARAPQLALPTGLISRTIEKGLSLEPELVLLTTTHASLLNGCSFCADLHQAQAVQAKLGLEKFRALRDFEVSALFSEREAAALAYCEEVTRSRKVSDATFARLRAHFGEREIVELTWLIAIGNFFNLMATSLEIDSDGLVQKLAETSA
jgi:alkylhydroperoxidase family enzyme